MYCFKFSLKYFNNNGGQTVFKNFFRYCSTNNMVVSKYNKPRRAILYVPGSNEKMLKKSATLNVDCVAMDCEDGVAMNKKAEARNAISKILKKGKPAQAKFDWAVRVNAVNSDLCDEDLRAILSDKCIPETILLPKIESTEHMRWFTEKVKMRLECNSKFNLVMMIESALGMINLVDICKYATERKSNFIPCALLFGSDDLCANIGAVRTEDQIEILYARQKLVLVAKAFGLQAIDMVYINYKDLIGLEKQCLQGMRMGYTGKQVIHPSQIDIVQKAFLPTEKQVKWARGIINTFKQHEKSGVGAYNYEGIMIDMPTLKIAQNIVKLVDVTKQKDGETTKKNNDV